MNVMMVSDRPEECAKSLDDLRLRALTREACQIACTALSNLGVEPDECFYKPFQPHNRFTKWCQSSRANFDWLCDFILHGVAEMEHRGFKLPEKQVEMSVCLSEFREFVPESKRWIETCERTREIMRSGTGDAREAYRILLTEKWEFYKVKPKWTNRAKRLWSDDRRNHETRI